MNGSRSSLQQGMTLVELSVTLLILAMLASVAVRSTADLQNQARYQQTQERLEMIREAILGDPRKTVNGQAVMSGFVADMGRLPEYLRELVEPGACSVPTYRSPNTCVNNAETWTWGAAGWPWATGVCSIAGNYTQASCEAATGVWTANLANLGVGWRGPYLRSSQNPNDTDTFTDGWGREGDNLDYGWRWRLLPGYLEILSAGSDFIGIGHIADAATCAAAGGIWDANFLLCTFATEASCSAAGGSWNGAGCLRMACGSANEGDCAAEILPQDQFVDIGGGIGITLTSRHGANGYCGFNGGGATQPSCENAGGTWSGACKFDVASCKSVGGKWQSCFFTPAACAAAGGTARVGCQFSQKSCNAAGGSTNYTTQLDCEGAGAYWDTTNSKCLSWDARTTGTSTPRSCLVLTSPALCGNAGGTWNPSSGRCDFSEGSCSLAGGAWTSDCGFTNATCAAAGGTWDGTNQPYSCGFTQPACTALKGVSNNSQCYMTHGEYTGAKYDPASCTAASGAWTDRICLNVYYRSPYTGWLTYASSGPVAFEANGGPQTLRFTGFVDSGDANGNLNVTEPLSVVLPFGIPAGTNAIGIYEFDGDCGVDNPPYPAGHPSPVPVTFNPRAEVPAINW